MIKTRQLSLFDLHQDEPFSIEKVKSCTAIIVVSKQRGNYLLPKTPDVIHLPARTEKSIVPVEKQHGNYHLPQTSPIIYLPAHSSELSKVGKPVFPVKKVGRYKTKRWSHETRWLRAMGISPNRQSQVEDLTRVVKLLSLIQEQPEPTDEKQIHS